jgi:hypothetical protein
MYTVCHLKIDKLAKKFDSVNNVKGRVRKESFHQAKEKPSKVGPS